MKLQQQLEPPTPNQTVLAETDSQDSVKKIDEQSTDYSYQLLERLNRAALRRKRFYTLATLCSISSISTVPLMNSDQFLQSFNFSAVVFALFMAAFLGTVAFISGGARESKLLADSLEGVDDIQAVGPSVQALTLVLPPDISTYRAAIPTLKRLLPKLTIDDCGLLNTQQCNYLNRALKFSTNPREKKLYDLDFAIAILQALTIVGNNSSLPYVHAAESLKGEGEKVERIRTLATHCAKAIEVRTNDELEPTRLLRAVKDQDSQESVLLRPTAGSVKTDTDSLLQSSYAAKDGNSQ